jgi:hypothetical protein
MRVDGQHHAPASLPREGAAVPFLQETVWVPGPVWMGVEQRKLLTTTGLRTTKRPTRRESL